MAGSFTAALRVVCGMTMVFAGVSVSLGSFTLTALDGAAKWPANSGVGIWAGLLVSTQGWPVEVNYSGVTWAPWHLKSFTPLFNGLSVLTTKKTQTCVSRVSCEGNPPVTNGFPSQRTQWCRQRHDVTILGKCFNCLCHLNVDDTMVQSGNIHCPPIVWNPPTTVVITSGGNLCQCKQNPTDII